MNGELRIYNYTESIDTDDDIELPSNKKRKIVFIIYYILFIN